MASLGVAAAVRAFGDQYRNGLDPVARRGVGETRDGDRMMRMAYLRREYPELSMARYVDAVLPLVAEFGDAANAGFWESP